MKRPVRISVVIALALLPLGVARPVVHAAYPQNQDDGVNDQASVDRVATAQDYAGLWGDVTGGVAGRPFVTNLSVTVTPSAGQPISQTFIDRGTISTPQGSTAGDLSMVINPSNVCNKAKGETEAPGRCYSNPNRLGASIVYSKGNGRFGTNFSNPTDSNGQPLSTPLLDAIKATGSTTSFDVTINMNTWGQTLRWSWLNGEPTYWNVASLGSPDSVVRLKYNLKTGPDVPCDTRIPVEGCNPTDRYTNFVPDKVLKTDFVFSLDKTGIDSVFTGALFASSNADMGSLEAVPAGSPTLGLTYGISGPNELSNQPAIADFYAVVSDTSLVNYFGVTPEVLSSADFKNSETLTVQRKDGGTTGAQGWTRWTSDANGLDGYFLSVSGIQFDGQAVSSNSVKGFALRSTKAAKFVMGKKITGKVSVSKSGSKQRLTLGSTSSKCKKATCRWVVSTSSSKLSTKLKKLATVPTRKGTASATALVTAKKGTRMSVVLQVKSGNKWKFVTSRMVVGK